MNALELQKQMIATLSEIRHNFVDAEAHLKNLTIDIKMGKRNHEQKEQLKQAKVIQDNITNSRKGYDEMVDQLLKFFWQIVMTARDHTIKLTDEQITDLRYVFDEHQQLYTVGKHHLYFASENAE